MSMIDTVRGDMVAAMKAKDKKKKEVLSGLLQELKNYEINNRVELDDATAGNVVLKMIKQLNETISLTPADRVDAIEDAKLEISILSDYAPKLMSEDEIKEVVKEVLAELELENPTVKEKGKIMKTLMPKVKGKADGKFVNEVLATFFA